MNVDPQLIVVFVVLGAFVGFLAGLLGIGGGMTMVPFLTIIFTQQGFPLAHVVHMAVATSTATIIFTALSSAREHHKHGAVLWAVVAGLAPGIIVGSLVGPQVVGGMSTALWILTLHQVMNGTDRKPPPAPTMLETSPIAPPTPKSPTLPGSSRVGLGLRSSSICVAENATNVPKNAASQAAGIRPTICGPTSEPAMMPGARPSTMPHSTAPWRWCSRAEEIAVNTIVAVDVATAMCTT